MSSGPCGPAAAFHEVAAGDIQLLRGKFEHDQAAAGEQGVPIAPFLDVVSGTVLWPWPPGSSDVAT